MKEQLLVKERIQAEVEKKRYWPRRKQRWLIGLLLGALLLGEVLLGTTSIGGWLSFFRNVDQMLAQGVQSRITVTPSPLTDQAVHRFMDAMMQKNWAGMWSLLHPDAQKLWQGQQDFMHVEQAKFGALKFNGYGDVPLRIAYLWRDPNTTQVYPYAALFSISLQASAPKGLLSVPSNTALNAGLFNNTLFALTQYHSVWQVLVAGPADLEAAILVPASAPAVRLAVPIFMYHHVSLVPTKNLLDYELTVRTTDFDAQLTWLQAHHYHSITQTELFDALYYGKVLPVNPMILSFDDGYKDAFTDALPVLLAHGYRGVFYIVTGIMGGRYMTWEQVHILARDGMQISSHTVHHVNIGNPPRGTSTQDELLRSKATLEAQFDQPIQFFCYPIGEPFHHDTLAQQQAVLADLFKDGYVGATLDPIAFFSAIQDARLPYELNRLRVSGGETLSAFVGILTTTLKNSELLLEAGGN